MSGEILATFKPNIKNLGRLTDEGELKLILIFRRARRRTAMDVNFMRNQRMKKKKWFAGVIILRLSTL